MKELISMNEYGFMADKNGVARVDSRNIAEAFGKEHYNVLRDIERLTDPKSGLSEGFTALNFEASKYTDSTGRRLPCYLLTRDGFTMLAMGYTGQKAMRFKEAYIKRFNDMEAQIAAVQSLRDECPMLLEALKIMSDGSSPFVYSNEMNLLNKTALGMNAKQYKEKHGLSKNATIRSHCTAGEADLLRRLQKMDIGFVYGGLTYAERKQKLEWYAYQWRDRQKELTVDDDSTVTDGSDNESDTSAA